LEYLLEFVVIVGVGVTAASSSSGVGVAVKVVVGVGVGVFDAVGVGVISPETHSRQVFQGPLKIVTVAANGVSNPSYNCETLMITVFKY
jgi:hypothetical protein